MTSRTAVYRRRKHAAEGHVLLKQSVAQAVDTTGWGSLLVLTDVGLSVLSVVLYVVGTYFPLNPLYIIQLALAAVFFLNWVFFCWIAQDRLHYVFSFFTVVDIITIVPAFVLFGLATVGSETLPRLNFLRVLRILRVLRVFRMKHIMRRHLEGAVTEAASQLGLALLCILFIAAGFYYELEKFRPEASADGLADLYFHEALYFAAVTITTVGYGDYTPTYWLTQTMVIALLALTFTVLPYLTGQLMNALSSTSSYQRKRYKPSRRSGMGHIVIMGFLDGSTLQGLLDQIYHEDKGYNRNHTVILADQAPDQDVKHALYRHDAASKVSYLQGSPFQTEDLYRAAIEQCTAVLFVAPKHPVDPWWADRFLTSAVLFLGQYLQERHALLASQLAHMPHRLMRWIRLNTVLAPRHLPKVFMQVCLPDGQLRLHRVLHSMQGLSSKPPGLYTHSTSIHPAKTAAEDMTAPEADAAAGPEGQAAAATGLTPTQDPAPGAAITPQALSSGSFPSYRPLGQSAQPPSKLSSGQAHTAVELGSCSPEGLFWQPPGLQQHRPLADQQQRQADGSSHHASRAAEMWPAGHKLRQGVQSGCAFWQEFSASIHVMCLAEIKYAMMAQSVVGVPGVMTLLCNLSTTVDFGLGTKEFGHLPPWLRDYMVGASQEVYQLQHFPSTLVGRTVRDAAGFIYDCYNAVLLAVETTKGISRHRMVVGDLEQVVTEDMHGYIVACDISTAHLVAAAQEGEFELWQQQQLQQQGKLFAISTGMTNGITYSYGGLVHSHKALGTDTAQQQEQLQPFPGSASSVCLGQQPQQQLPHLQPLLPGTFFPAAGSVQRGQEGISGSSLCEDPQAAGTLLESGISSPLGELLYLLHSPSQSLRQQGEALLRQNYLVRPGDALKSPEDLVVERAAVSEHILVLGVPASPDSLLALLAPLRTRRLRQWRPIVIVDQQRPVGGSGWDAIAQFREVYFIELRDGHLNDALLRASAEHALQAVLATPLAAYTYDTSSADRLTSRVTADAMVVHAYQLLKSLNPSMQLLTEVMLPQDMVYLDAVAPTLGVPSKHIHLMSSAYISGSVFYACLLDSLMIASSSNNNASTRITLQLLHSWHTSWATSPEQGSASLTAQQPAAPTCYKGHPTPELPSWQHLGSPQSNQERVFAAQQPPALAAGQQQLQTLSALADVHCGGDQEQQLAYGRVLWEQQQQLMQEGQPEQQPWAAAAALTEQAQPAGGAAGVPPDDAHAAGFVGQSRCSVLLQIRVACLPGTTYGRYFHLLLHTRGLLLLGVHRLVQQDGVCFRATITNPSYDYVLQPDDHAFVVARLPLPADCGDADAVAAAWPPDTLGFSNLT